MPSPRLSLKAAFAFSFKGDFAILIDSSNLKCDWRLHPYYVLAQTISCFWPLVLGFMSLEIYFKMSNSLKLSLHRSRL